MLKEYLEENYQFFMLSFDDDLNVYYNGSKIASICKDESEVFHVEWISALIPDLDQRLKHSVKKFNNTMAINRLALKLQEIEFTMKKHLGIGSIMWWNYYHMHGEIMDEIKEIARDGGAIQDLIYKW